MNELMKRDDVTPNIIEMAEILAEKTYRMLGISKENLRGIYLKGWELGFKMTASPQFIQSIQGKPSLSPEGHLALLHNSGLFNGDGCFEVQDIRNDKGDPFACRVKMRRNDSGVEYENTFTMDDAKRAGLIKQGSGWEKYPANMLRWRAIGYCADIVASDIGGGMLRADEIGINISPDGQIIEGEVIEQETIQTLTDKYGHSAVLDAMQKTGGDIDAMIEILEADNGI